MPSWTIFRSVPQMPQARTRTSTSSSPGTGTGRCCSSNLCGATSTVAFIVLGTISAPFWISNAPVTLGQSALDGQGIQYYGGLHRPDCLEAWHEVFFVAARGRCVDPRRRPAGDGP